MRTDPDGSTLVYTKSSFGFTRHGFIRHNFEIETNHRMQKRSLYEIA